jgi:dUTP pyrophosphatase
MENIYSHSLSNTFPTAPVHVKVVNKSGLPLPVKATSGSAAYDVSSIEEGFIPPREIRKFRTGLYFEIPYGWEIHVFPRSGLSTKHGILIPNSPGLIDSDYRGELMVGLLNTTDTFYHVKKGDRIAQIKIVPSFSIVWEEVESVENLSQTTRGSGGFGHTG